jgi:hypothetical protein
MRKLNQDKDILDNLFAYIFCIFLITTTFDLTVTVYNYVKNPNFIEMEANQLFTWGIESSWPMPFNPVLLIHYLLILSYLSSKALYEKYPKKHWTASFYTGNLIIFILVSAAHTFGGLSWFYV